MIPLHSGIKLSWWMLILQNIKITGCYNVVWVLKSILLKFLYVMRDVVGNSKNSIANCIFYLTKKSNQPEDGS